METDGQSDSVASTDLTAFNTADTVATRADSPGDDADAAGVDPDQDPSQAYHGDEAGGADTLDDERLTVDSLEASAAGRSDGDEATSSDTDDTMVASEAGQTANTESPRLDDGSENLTLHTDDSSPASEIDNAEVTDPQPTDDEPSSAPIGQSGFEARLEHGASETTSSSLPDDVVIGTTFMPESEQPGYYNEASERPTVTGEIERAPETPVRDPVSPGSPAEAEPNLDYQQAAPATKDGSATQDRGMDVDWEPWGAGGAGPDAAETGLYGEADGLPIDQSVPASGDPEKEQGVTSPPAIAQARMLLDQLQVVLASIEQSPSQTDPAGEAAGESMAEVNQLVEGFPATAIEADRLAELTRLAEDLSGRDYDIRALQRFAQERELILSLAVEFQQQRDVIAQIRSVLSKSG